MRRRTHNYSNDSSTLENLNYDGKYAITGESEFSRDLTIPYEDNDVLIERHLVLGDSDIGWEKELTEYNELSDREDHSGKGPIGYQRSDDRIYEDVCETLWRSPQVDPSEIEVKVDNGVVTLQGVVHKRDFKRWAERLIDDIPGVLDVNNQIRVITDPGGLVQNRTGMI